jgi:hypothetical protein
MLIVAGIIEGFISPSTNIAPHWKFTLAGVLATAFYGWLFIAGRRSATRGAEYFTRP